MSRLRNRGRGPKQKLRDADRRAQALSLRRSGMSFDAIAARMGYANRGSAQQIVARALEDLWTEPAEAVRKIELDRLDKSHQRLERIIRAHLPDACKKGVVSVDPETGEARLVVADGAIRTVLESIKAQIVIAARRAKYLGLDAPEKRELTGKSGGPIEVSGLTDEQLLALASGAYPAAGLADGGGGDRAAPSLASGDDARTGADADAEMGAAEASIRDRPTH